MNGLGTTILNALSIRTVLPFPAFIIHLRNRLTSQFPAPAPTRWRWDLISDGCTSGWDTPDAGYLVSVLGPDPREPRRLISGWLGESDNCSTPTWHPAVSLIVTLVQLRLSHIQLIVSAALGQQVIVVAALNDPAVFDHEDGIGVPHRRKAVRDDEYSPIPHQCI